MREFTGKKPEARWSTLIKHRSLLLPQQPLSVDTMFGEHTVTYKTKTRQQKPKCHPNRSSEYCRNCLGKLFAFFTKIVLDSACLNILWNLMLLLIPGSCVELSWTCFDLSFKLFGFCWNLIRTVLFKMAGRVDSKTEPMKIIKEKRLCSHRSHGANEPPEESSMKAGLYSSCRQIKGQVRQRILAYLVSNKEHTHTQHQKQM